MIYECERRLQIDAAAETVWHWMADVRRLLRLNVFHAAVEYAQPVCQAGLAVPIRHNVLWLYRRTRIARIRAYRTYFVAWGELQEHGVDRFPHSQSFTVIPVDAQRCVVVNRLRGKFVMPGARYWFLPFYRLLAPRLLDYENRSIAVAVAAMTSTAEALSRPIKRRHAYARTLARESCLGDWRGLRHWPGHGLGLRQRRGQGGRGGCGSGWR